MGGAPCWTRGRSSDLGDDLDRAVVIAVLAMRMVQVPVDEVVDVVAMRDRGVTAIGAVLVVGGVALAAVLGRAVRGVVAVHREHVLVDVTLVGVVQVPVVQVVDVPLVPNGGVPAPLRVLVLVAFVSVVSHETPPSPQHYTDR